MGVRISREISLFRFEHLTILWACLALLAACSSELEKENPEIDPRISQLSSSEIKVKVEGNPPCDRDNPNGTDGIPGQKGQVCLKLSEAQDYVCQ